MNLKDNVPPAVLTAATGLLQPYAPDLSPSSLVRAIRAYQIDGTTTTATNGKSERPMTRREVAALLNCTLQTVSRYMNDGKIRRIRLSPTSVRIDAASVHDFLNGVSIGNANDA